MDCCLGHLGVSRVSAHKASPVSAFSRGTKQTVASPPLHGLLSLSVLQLPPRLLLSSRHQLGPNQGDRVIHPPELEWTSLLLTSTPGQFPGSPMVVTCDVTARAWVQSPVREPRSGKPHSLVKKTKTKKPSTPDDRYTWE